MKIGTRVKYIKETGPYSLIGKFGTVVDIDRTGIRVKWDSGAKYKGIWWCAYEDVEEMHDEEPNEPIDKVIGFFEMEENWKALKNC